MAAKSESHLDLERVDTPACATSVTIDLGVGTRTSTRLLREANHGVLAATGPYPRYTTGVMLIPGTDVQILHGRSDDQYSIQVVSPYGVVRDEVDLCRQQLFTDARLVRLDCLEIRFEVGEIGAGWNGRGGPASPSPTVSKWNAAQDAVPA